MRSRTTPVAATMGHLLASGDPEAIRLVCARLRPFLQEHQGNLTRAALSSGVPLRTLMRWQATYSEVSAEVDAARALAQVA